MLINKKVKINKKGNKNLNYYESLGYNLDEHVDYIEVYSSALTTGSKCIVESICDFCHKIVEIKYNLYLKNISSNNLFACSPKCGKNKSKITNIKRWGVEYINQVDSIKEKKKNTSLKNWGTDVPSKSEEIKNKIKSTNLKRWGVEYTFQSEEIREKSKRTLLENWGVDHNFKSLEIREKSKRTLLENWGVDNPSRSEEIKNKKRETSLLNWGTDVPSKSEEIKNKIKSTNLKRWGVEWPMMLDINKDKSIQSFKLRWGVEWNSQIDTVKESMKIKNLEKWGVEYTLQSREIRERIRSTNIDKYNSPSIFGDDNFRLKNFKIASDENYIKYLSDKISLFHCNDCSNDCSNNFEITSINYFSRKKSNLPLCTVCNPIGDSQSIKEGEIFEFIKSIYDGKVIQSYRDGLEIDIYLPKLNMGFEFNGLYWHSEEYKDKWYHLNKTKYFKEKGIRIIHIWEDDWDHKKDIIKSQIINWIVLTTNKIFARKCEVKEIIDSKVVTKFLNDNHIQGSVRSNLKLGLYHEGELVSLMTFDNYEGRNKMKEEEWNINRFCNKLDYNVIGGASKLFKYFIDNYDVSRVISYADRDWSIGNLYETLGFKKVNESNPDYKYIIEGKRVHKSRFRKSRINTKLTESEFMKKSQIYKIWDCGKIKFELIISSS